MSLQILFQFTLNYSSVLDKLCSRKDVIYGPNNKFIVVVNLLLKGGNMFLIKQMSTIGF
jgi:hypothetical protein